MIRRQYDSPADLWGDDESLWGDSANRFSLYELNNLVAQTLAAGMPDEYWVEAELSEVREVRGHCYMELVQKDGEQNVPVARASAKCWRSSWAMVKPAFERATGQTLHAGIKVLLRVYADFHEAYGFSWIVTGINPEYTLGDLVRRRQQIIRQLKAEGVFDLQHGLSLPVFAQRIAVVSSGGAAGYGDFINQLADNAHGYAFSTTLFPAVMQGDGVEASVIAALDTIYNRIADFDAVVIIRGGGATSDLSGFDTLLLAENVANFPLPVITGIGHDRDESVLDMVAHTHVKTPTAAAVLFIDHLAAVDSRLDGIAATVAQEAGRMMERGRVRLERMAQKVPMLFSLVKAREQSRLERAADTMASALRHRIAIEQHRMDMLQQRVAALNPALILHRGYSITLHNGRAVRSPGELPKGSTVETRVEQGTFKSVVE